MRTAWRSLRWRLVGSYVALALVLLGFAGYVFSNALSLYAMMTQGQQIMGYRDQATAILNDARSRGLSAEAARQALQQAFPNLEVTLTSDQGQGPHRDVPDQAQFGQNGHHSVVFPPRPPRNADSIELPYDSGGEHVGIRLSLRGGEGAVVVTSLYRQVLVVLGVTLGLAGLVGWLLSRWLATPLAQLGTATEAVAGGDFLQTVPAPGIAELDRVNEQFNRMVLRLRDSFQALALERDAARRFATDAAHELKTPVTTLRAYHEVLEEHPERASQVAPAVGRQIDRMERVIAGLLELARLGEGTGINLEAGDAAAVLRDLEPAYRELVEESGHRLIISGLDQALPVLLDRRLLEVAVTNLVDNACKYTAPGGQVSLLAERTGHDAVITVADTGKGIAPEELPYVFERFHRGVDTQTIPGTGLGLAMAQESVRRMGGELTAESTLGAGSRFIVRLPLL